jgi:V8-like Glu-specific endopeptidase
MLWLVVGLLAVGMSHATERSIDFDTTLPRGLVPIAPGGNWLERTTKEDVAARAVGALFVPLRNSAASAFLIAPCHILTAAHVVRTEQGLPKDERYEFFIGTGHLSMSPMSAHHFAHHSTAKLVIVSRPTVWREPARLLRQDPNDWALLALEDCLGGPGFPYGHLTLRALTRSDEEASAGRVPVRVIGYPMRMSAGMRVAQNCDLIAPLGGTAWVSDCASAPGMSGGPVLASDGTVVAIITQGIYLDGANTFHAPLPTPRGSPDYYRFLTNLQIANTFISDVRAVVNVDIAMGNLPVLGPTDDAGKSRFAAEAAYRKGAEALLGSLTSVARAAFERAIDLDPEMGAARFELARLEFNSSDPARRQLSMDLLWELHRSWPNDRTVLHAMMMAQVRAMDCDDANQTFRTWLSVTGLPPDHRAARTLAADISICTPGSSEKGHVHVRE